MKTETKIITGILTLTAIIIFGGIVLFKGRIEQQSAVDFSKYIKTGLLLDKTKISRDYNPKITGLSKSSAIKSTTTIEVTEFLDYLCPACATTGEMINKALIDEYGSNIIITRKIFPVHGQTSVDIGVIILASQILGNEAYQNIHAKAFETFSEWSILGKKDRENFLKKMIIDLGYDFEKILTESKNPKYAEQIAMDKQDSIDLGITATPSFIINNEIMITGGLPIEEFKKLIDKTE